MKKLFFILAIFLHCVIFCQSAKDSIVFLASKSLSIYSQIGSDCYPAGSSNKKYFPGKFLFVTNISECNRYGTKKNVLEVYFDGTKHFLVDDPIDANIFMIQGKEIALEDLKNSFQSRGSKARDSANRYANAISIVYIKKLLQEAEQKVFAKQKYGIAILQAHPTEDYSFTGAKFKILNFNKKSIKYITFNFYGKNPVNDKVGATLSRKGIGPVQHLATGSWEFENVWLTDVVETMKLISVNIIYMDGSTKAIPITDNHWMDEDDLDNFDKLIEE